MDNQSMEYILQATIYFIKTLTRMNDHSDGNHQKNHYDMPKLYQIDHIK